MNTHTNTFDLSSRTMLCSLNIGQWTARKLDKRVTREINESHGASHDAGRYNKVLIAQESLKAIARIAGQARTTFYHHTSPWLDDGLRILPSANYQAMAAKMREHKESFEQAVSEFVAAYPDLVDDARQRLNGMFNAADYPDQYDIACRFSWHIRTMPMASDNDFRVDLASEQVESIRQSIRADLEHATQAAMSDAWSRLHGVVSKMSERLTAYKAAENGGKATGIFRDSLVENIRDLIDVLPALNIAGDANLSAMIDRARDELCGHDAGALRDDALTRDQVKQSATEISDAMAAFM